MRRIKKTVCVSFLQHLLTIVDRRAMMTNSFCSCVWRMIGRERKKLSRILTASEIVLMACFIILMSFSAVDWLSVGQYW